MAIANYTSQIGTMRKENPSAFKTDEDAYAWGQRNYGWNDQGGSNTGSSSGGGSTTAGWGDQSKYPDTYSFTPTEAPAFTAPGFQTNTTAAPTWGGPAAFQYGAFQAPDASTVQNDPGYQFRLQQGVKARDASAAAKGTLRGGNQMLALDAYGQGLASDEYDRAYGRAADTYDRNYGVARDQYGLAYDAARDAYGRGIDERGFAVSERDKTYDANFRNRQAEYDPARTTWEATQLAKQREAELNFNAGQERDFYSRNDQWRRDQLGADDSYRNRSLSQQDKQFYADLEESRRRYLATLGAQ